MLPPLPSLQNGLNSPGPALLSLLATLSGWPTGILRVGVGGWLVDTPAFRLPKHPWGEAGSPYPLGWSGGLLIWVLEEGRSERRREQRGVTGTRQLEKEAAPWQQGTGSLGPSPSSRFVPRESTASELW